MTRNKHGLLALCFSGLFSCSAVAGILNIDALTPAFEAELSDGSHGVLEGIVPIGKRGKAPILPSGWHDAAVRSKTISEDRYGRARIMLYRQSDDALLQATLVQQGRAMAYAYDRALPNELAALPAPNAARFHANDAKQALRQWAEISGKIRSVSLRKTAAYLNFGEDWKSDFTIYLPKQTLKRFDPNALKALEGKQVRVRGYVHSYYGPRITLFEPSMLESLDEPR